MQSMTTMQPQTKQPQALPSLRIWRGIGLELPPDWEMLRFARTVTDGRCSFADRYQLRLELSWRVAPTAPDFQRLSTDYLSQLQKAGHDSTAFTTRHAGPWHGIVGQTETMANSRYSRHLVDAQLLVELVFFWPEELDAKCEARILSSVHAVPAAAPGVQRWRAFGMDLLAGSKLDLSLCRVNPADVCLQFTGGDGKRPQRRETFQRLGMVSRWLNVPVGDWLAEQLPHGTQDRHTTDREARGHRICRAVGKHRSPGVSFIRNRWMEVETAAWICPHDGRLYAVSRQSVPSGESSVVPVEQLLSCCTSRPLPL